MRFVAVLVLLAHASVVNSAAAQPAKTPRLDVNGKPLPDGAVARLGTWRFQPPGYARASALSPDGTIVATTHDSERGGTRIHFMKTSTGKTLRELDLDRYPNQIDQVKFTPDGKRLVFTDFHAITLIDAVTGKVARSIDVASPGRAIAFTSDGKWLAAQPQKYVYDAPVGVWETSTGKEVALLPGRGASCRGLAFGRDGKHLLLWSVVPTEAHATGMSFGDESKVAVACIDTRMRKIVGEMTVGTNQAASGRHVALCPDGETVAFEAADHQSVRIRHLSTGGVRCVIPVKQAKFAFAPDGQVLFTIDESGRGTLWNASRGSKIRDLEGALVNKDFRILGMSQDGKTIAVLDGGWYSAPMVVVWDAATGKRRGRPPGHEGIVTCIAYGPGGKLLASGSFDKTVRLWNPITGEHLRLLTVHKEAITAVAISPDAKLAASSSQDGTTRLSRIADGKLVAEVFTSPAKSSRRRRPGRSALAFSQDGAVLYAGGEFTQVVAWDIAGAKELARPKTGQGGSVVAFGDGGALALTVKNGAAFNDAPALLQVWNPTNQPVASISIGDEHRGNVRCEAAIFSPVGRMLASSQVSVYQGIRPSYGAAQVRLWEQTSGQPIRTLAPSITRVLAFSPDSRLLAAGAPGESGHLMVGYGSGIDIWDTVTGEKAAALEVSPECLAFSPDGMHLATGGWDHNVLIWNVPQLAKKVKSPTAAERDAWWNALSGQAKDAYKAMGQMIDAPDDAVALLKQRVRPVCPSDRETVAKLIVQLDSRKYTERVSAQTALEKMGEGAAHLIARALEKKVNLELRRRLEALLRKCSALGLREHRAIATLEWIGTPAARAVLRTLAAGARDARLTVEARAALKRLEG
jgi:WD40 repeat protein